jgi:Cleavage and polyadenylation factor 2 C-terminal
VTFEVREEAVGIGQDDAVAKYGIGESVGRAGDVTEDDYGISVQHDRFTDIVSGVDPSKFAGGSGRIGEEVTRRGFGYGVDASNRAYKSKKASSGQGSSRVISEDEEQDDRDELDEQVLEAVDLSEGNGIIRGRKGRPPTKVSTVPRKVEVLAEVSYVPGLEGRVDARAARQSVRALQPREVVVLGGSKTVATDGNVEALVSDEVTLLAEAAKSFATGSKMLFTPNDGETAELAVGHAAYSVRLIDNPFVTPEEKETMEGAPEPIEPFEAKLGLCTVAAVDCIATGQKVAIDDSIVLAPRRQATINDEPTVFVSDGEVLLTDLRTELIALGMKAEYSAHAGYSQLVLNGKVIVKKEHSDTGRMNVEGPLCEDFFKVRSVVCGQYVAL